MTNFKIKNLKKWEIWGIGSIALLVIVTISLVVNIKYRQTFKSDAKEAPDHCAEFGSGGYCASESRGCPQGYKSTNKAQDCAEICCYKVDTEADKPWWLKKGQSGGICQKIETYSKDWNRLSESSVLDLEAGSQVNFCAVVSSGGFSRADFTVNGKKFQSEIKRPNSTDLCQIYTISLNEKKFTVEASVWGEASGSRSCPTLSF